MQYCYVICHACKEACHQSRLINKPATGWDNTGIVKVDRFYCRCGSNNFTRQTEQACRQFVAKKNNIAPAMATMRNHWLLAI